MTIVITEFAFCPKTKRIHLVFEPRERDHHELLLSEHLQIHVLQLNEVIKGHVEVLNDVVPELAHWSQFLALGYKKSEAEMAALTDNDPRIIEAHREFRHFTADPKTRELERQRRLFLLDYHLGMEASKDEGEVKGRRDDVLDVLRIRFKKISKRIETAIQQMNDPIALKSLLAEATACQTLDEFAEVLS
ncbi:hypothetical protein FACS189427_06840 [Planctomycetales bacterium]|nr:hypothetical protein FACS189427_06840 [Planctomycetales bacterium]